MFSRDAPDDFVDELMTENNLKKTGYFNPGKVSRLYAKYRSNDHNFSNEFQNMALIGVLSTQLVHKQFIEDFSSRAVRTNQTGQGHSSGGSQTVRTCKSRNGMVCCAIATKEKNEPQT